ncbi:antibiotic biosynthesis monooxygenase [Cupriavidus sp. AU9028]|uniref:antibiotic biosynthesis monooxygenase family protein n=1 Tax=Cupriavidus sp. AU9028 TaxID=2871157 RepID=UPI001C945575|nr:antibiotic biosynthesis monooxygenase [Cupriavidus sp. AU9028]MBY4896733.1 antibiotic biosynthesis monooxygenase [Cupriavidus sp. AU9028]
MASDTVFAQTPAPPYYAVIFTSTRTPATADDGYGAAAQRMVELASGMPGFLGVESVRDGSAPGAPGITVSYWQSLDAIAAWRAHAEHVQARNRGRERWYDGFQLRICKVERAYGFSRD